MIATSQPNDMPTNLEAERSLIGSCLCDPSNFALVESLVSDRDFADDGHRRAWASILTLWHAGEPVGDSRALPTLLRRVGVWDALGGAAGLARLIAYDSVTDHPIYHAREVARCSDLRRQIRLADAIRDRATDFRGDPAAIRQFIEGQLAAFQSPTTHAVRSVGEIASESVAAIAEDCAVSHRPGVMTGIWTFDQSMGSLMRSELTLLAARPSVGKTALGMQIAEHVAEKSRRSMVVSLEMRDRELVDRMLAKHSGINGRKIRARKLDQGDIAKLRGAAGAMGDLSLRVWAPPAATTAQIRAVAKVEHARGGLDLLVVDYVGLVAARDHSKPRHEQVSEVSAGLKALAKELDIPVLALCQLNREAETQKPGLHNLRDSGSLEQDADMVIFLHKERRDDPQADLIVAKNRNGEIGEMRLDWHREATRFSDPNQPQAHGAFNDFNNS